MTSPNIRDFSVLVDTNVIIESHRTRSWEALTGALRIETVEDCVIETQTGFQMRREEETIDVGYLEASLFEIHQVSDEQRVELAIRTGGIALDRGEESLWSHALTYTDAWILCSPDKASLRCGVKLGLREKLVSLEGLLGSVGHHPKIALKRAYTKNWHDRETSKIVVEEYSY